MWGANAERVCVPEKYAVEVPEDLDPGQVVSLVFPYMTAYQMLHRTARVTSGETVLVHGAAAGSAPPPSSSGRWPAFGSTGPPPPTTVPRSSGWAQWRSTIGTRTSWRMRELEPDGVDVVLDGIGGAVSLRSFRGCGNPIFGDPGGRLVMIGNYNTMVQGHKSWRGWMEWYPATAAVWLWGMLSPRRRVIAYRVQKLRIGHQEWFREDFRTLLELLRAGSIHPVVAERMPLSDARRAHEMLEQSAAKGQARARPVEMLTDAAVGLYSDGIGPTGEPLDDLPTAPSAPDAGR